MDYTISASQLKIIQIASAVLIASIMLIILAMKNNRELPIKFHLTTLTGMIIYAPYVFVPRPEYAIVMGVGMHWMQYLALTIPIYMRKTHALLKDGKRNFITKIGSKKRTLWGYLLIYAAAMVFLRQWGIGFTSFDYSSFYIIPMTLQMLHFYYDSFMWRFSEPHIRSEVGTYIFAKTVPNPAISKSE